MHEKRHNVTDLVGSADACRILRIDRSTLSRWVAAGRLSVVTRLPGPNGAMLFDRASVADLAEHLAKAEAPA